MEKLGTGYNREISVTSVTSVTNLTQCQACGNVSELKRCPKCGMLMPVANPEPTRHTTPPIPPEPPISAPAIASECIRWPFVSRRLHIALLPVYGVLPDTLWSALEREPVLVYRLTPTVYVWFERASVQYEERLRREGRLVEIDALTKSFDLLTEYASDFLDAIEVDARRRQAGEVCLPHAIPCPEFF